MEKKLVDVSVIVPIYNVEEYLEECLASLLRQGEISFEVIMIDDGSTDGSGVIAKRFEDEYENFHYHLIENGGLGHARNYAIQFVQGKYIAFVDSDDVIVDETYEKMFLLAEKNGSELTICNVARFNSKQVWSSVLHKRVFYNIKQKTHIMETTELINDTISCNKLILRSFYQKHDFHFPENIVYEDIPVTIPMHIFANHVSVLEEIGYCWRVRDGASKSITQNTSSMSNLKDRLTVLNMLNKFFADHVKEAVLHEAMQKKILEVDLMIFVNVCKTVPKDQALQIIRTVKDYIKKNIDQSVFEKLTILNKQKYSYVMQEDVEGLVSTCEYGESKYYNAKISENNGALFVELPESIFTIKDRDITKELAGYEPRRYIDDMVISNDKIEISTHVYTRRINIKDNSEQKISAYLYNGLTDSKIPLRVFPEIRDELTDSVGTVTDRESGTQTHYNYDGTGCKIVIDINEIKQYTNNFGWNKILLEYENRFSSGKVAVSGCSGKLKAKYKNSTVLADGFVARFSFDCIDEVRIFLERETTFGKSVSFSENNLICKINEPADAIWAVNENNNQKVLFEMGEQNEFFAPIDHFDKEKQYKIFVRSNGKERELLGNKKKINIRSGEKEAIITHTLRTYSYSVYLYDRITTLYKTDSEDNIIHFWTKTVGNAEELSDVISARLYVEDNIAGKTVTLAKTACKLKNGKIICRFTIDFSKRRINRDFYQSIRDIYIEYQLRDERVIKDIIYSNRYFKYVAAEETLVINCYRGLNGSVRLQIEQKWREEENSRQKREALTFQNYPLYRKEKINPKQIVFESMWGSKYSCNPQALYEYIDKNYPEYECIWFFNDARIPIKGKGKRVRRGSQEYYHYLATAKYFINNVNFAEDYVKRKGQVELQTMHGTPLKTFGLDVKDEFPTELSREKYIARNSRWNYLVVQGEFMAEKSSDMFKFDKEILRTGYPRTDKLFSSSQQSARKIKEALGLPEDKKVILYAPTWRVQNRFDMKLDLEDMRKKLSDEYILLIRIHYFSSSGYIIPEDREFIFNFNSYRYVEDLYLISDILITDYSSLMFDFALLNKPMLFFTYDLDEYCDSLRGIYIDFANEAPGPLLFQSEQVIQAILNLDEEMEKCKGRIEDFHKKFLTYEKPNSSELVVKRFLRPNPMTHLSYKVKRKLIKTLKRKK